MSVGPNRPSGIVVKLRKVVIQLGNGVANVAQLKNRATLSGRDQNGQGGSHGGKDSAGDFHCVGVAEWACDVEAQSISTSAQSEGEFSTAVSAHF